MRKAYGQNEKYSTYCTTAGGNALAKKIFLIPLVKDVGYMLSKNRTSPESST